MFSEILLRTGEHLVLVIIAMIIAIAIGIPLGIIITRKPKLAQPILIFANGLQTIPSLAIFGFLLSVPFFGGIGKIPAIVALTLYALLPLIRNTYVGIANVDPAIKEVGIAMGMTEWQLLTKVEIPLALEIILAGVRVATVISVGIATIAAAIGGGGLGVFIFRGISTVNNQLILAGAIPAAIIALLADMSLGWLEKTLKNFQTRKKLFTTKFLIILMTILLLFLGLGGINLLQTNLTKNNTIILGSKNFTESLILSEILAQQIENNTNLKVNRKFNLGGTFIAHEALKLGEIDGYVEYTGTALTAILQQPIMNNSQEVYEKVKQIYQEKFNLTVMPSLGFNSTFAIAIRGKDARNFNIKNISEVAKYTPNWQAGFGPEFLIREDGYRGLAKTYNLKFGKPPIEMDLGLLSQALATNKVDLIAGNATDGLIPVLDLVILNDDKQYFPPYEVVPIFYTKTLIKYPQIQDTINQLLGLISLEEIQKMNYLVDSKKNSVEDVAKDWLKSKKLTKIK